MMPYILHVAVLITFCYLAYHLLLAKETFFKLNRWILVACMFIPFLLPLVEVPAEWSLRPVSEPIISMIPTEPLPIEITEPIPPVAAPDMIVEPDVVDLAEPAVVTPDPTPKPTNIFAQLSFTEIFFYIYLIGVFIFGINWLIQLFTLIHLISSRTIIKDGIYRIIELKKETAPFSFLNCIFINPSQYDEETYLHIIEHEKIHIAQGHSMDIILAELLIVLQWFNPFAWKYRKIVENNLEYLTDHSMIRQGFHRESYQMNLLKVSVPQHALGLVTNYNQSELKKRIIMMNKMKSSLRSGWKYLSLLPVLGLSVLCLNVNKVTASQDQDAFTMPEPPLAAPSPQASPEPAISTVPEPIAMASEPTPMPEPVAEPAPAAIETAPEPVAAVLERKGIWTGEIEDDKFCVRMELTDLEKGHNWQMSRCFDRGEFENLRRNMDGEFRLIREAGELVFRGEFEGNEGFGRFWFFEGEDFRSYLRREGFRDIKEETMFHLFMADINRRYISFLQRNDYYDVTTSELKKLAIHRLTLPYLQEQLSALRDYGVRDVSISELVKMRIHHVTAEYIEDLADAGIRGLTVDNLVKGKIHHVKPEYIREFRSMGYRDLEFNDYVKFSIHHVKPEMVRELARAGYDDLTASQLQKAQIHHVNMELIRSLGDLRMEKPTFDQLIKFSIHHVRPEFIRSLRNAGFRDFTWDQAIKASIHHVTADYINEMDDMGIDMYSLEEVTQMAVHHVKPSYIAMLKDFGYRNLSAKEVRQAKIHHVEEDFIEGYYDLGYRSIPFKQLIELKIHHVTPDFVRRAEDRGYRDLSLSEYKKLKIHNLVK